ncbi:MAG: DoxX family protein [Aigarchaeota archaeon]|nr:DoxX family protein [Candidatus Pelearchaeum maunauluense]
MSRLIAYSLSITHFLWSLSLLLEPWRYSAKSVAPQLLALLHIITAVLLLASKTAILGGSISAAILTYYWIWVKPIEPIAEPQSVGIIAISTIFLIPYLHRILGSPLAGGDTALLLLRLGVAYPFVEWGLDAFRNPAHFIAFFSSNIVTRAIIPVEYMLPASYVLGVFELVVALSLVLGIAPRASAVASFTSLVVFSAIAGYPLALPQNIALAAASLYIYKRGAGRYSAQAIRLSRVMEKVLKGVFWLGLGQTNQPQENPTRTGLSNFVTDPHIGVLTCVVFHGHT